MKNEPPTFLWKNFKLGEELHVAGTFIYSGVRSFYEARTLDLADEIFPVFYSLSIGMERLMKDAIVLLEHKDVMDQEQFEKSLITHNQRTLLARIKRHTDLNLSKVHTDFLALLERFYKVSRYDRFSLRSTGVHARETRELVAFLERQLQTAICADPLRGFPNDERYKKLIRDIILEISSTLYELIEDRASRLNLYTYELRVGSKAERVFRARADIDAENILWKELLLFFMNTKEDTAHLRFLRGIESLPLDPADVPDMLSCFESDSDKWMIMDQIESLYEDLPNKDERSRTLALIGAPGVYFEEDDDNEVDGDLDFGDEDSAGDEWTS